MENDTPPKTPPVSYRKLIIPKKPVKENKRNVYIEAEINRIIQMRINRSKKIILLENLGIPYYVIISEILHEDETSLKLNFEDVQKGGINLSELQEALPENVGQQILPEDVIPHILSYVPHLNDENIKQVVKDYLSQDENVRTQILY